MSAGRKCRAEKQLGTTPYSLCGWFGGFESQNESATLTATFLNAAGRSLATVAIGGLKSVDRNGRTSLLIRSKTGHVPGTPTISISRSEPPARLSRSNTLRLA